MSQKVYKILSDAILHEKLGAETVIVNLDSGCYFTLTSSADLIWSYLMASYSPEEIIETIASNSKNELGEITTLVQGFIEQLEKEGLIIPCVEGEISQNKSLQKIELSSGFHFTVPEMEKYTDMQDLLMLDPIHEVQDEKGWPHAKAD